MIEKNDWLSALKRKKILTTCSRTPAE